MAYVSPNFRSKKALREAVKVSKRVTVFSPGPFPVASEGKVAVEGPHYPEPHRWYATVIVKNGQVLKVVA